MGFVLALDEMTKQLKDWNNVVFGNTKYFHTKTVIKRHKNRIKELKDENNIWGVEGGWFEEYSGGVL